MIDTKPHVMMPRELKPRLANLASLIDWEKLPWEFRGWVDPSFAYVRVVCDHHEPVQYYTPSGPVYAPEQEFMHGRLLPTIPVAPSSSTQVSIAMHEYIDRRTAVFYGVAQCAECGRIHWVRSDVEEMGDRPA